MKLLIESDFDEKNCASYWIFIFFNDLVIAFTTFLIQFYFCYMEE